MTTTTEHGAEQFPYPVLRCKDFDDVLVGQGEPIEVADLMELALRRGRVLVQGAGGSGKTWTLLRVAGAATDRGVRFALLRLTSISPTVGQALDLDLLLRLADPPTSLEAIGVSEPFLLLLDGLNEVERSIASSVIEAVEELAMSNPRAGCIITDRLARREIDTNRWVLATLGEVDPMYVQNRLPDALKGSESGLWSLPVYLNMILQDDSTPPERSASHERFLIGQMGLDDSDLNKLADLSLHQYQTTSTRQFLLNDIITSIGKDKVQSLLDGRALYLTDSTRIGMQPPSPPSEERLATGELVQWKHHLLHDYLAARGASKDTGLWNPKTFEALTFQASSFDALVMLLEQASAEQGDHLVRLVYDWNLYAAAFLLSQRFQGRRTVKESTEYQILSLLAERRFDRFLATAEQVSDALRIQESELARRLLQASTPTEILELAVRQLESDKDYRDWLETFALREGPAPGWLCDTLLNPDGVYGWTASNVIRRVGVDSAGLSTVFNCTRSGSAVVRWRAVHVLGVMGRDARDTLFTVFDEDDDQRVRYGALRSIVEQALLEENEIDRMAIFDALSSYASDIRTSRILTREFARILRVVDPPSQWAASASIVVGKLLADAPTVDEQDYWRNIGMKLRLEWAASK